MPCKFVREIDQSGQERLSFKSCAKLPNGSIHTEDKTLPLQDFRKQAATLLRAAKDPNTSLTQEQILYYEDLLGNIQQVTQSTRRLDSKYPIPENELPDWAKSMPR